MRHDSVSVMYLGYHRNQRSAAYVYQCRRAAGWPFRARRDGDGAMLRCDAKKRDDDGAMLRCDAKKRDDDGAMLRYDAQKHDGGGAMLRCDAKKRDDDGAMLRCDAQKHDGGGAMLRCDAQKHDGGGAMLRCYALFEHHIVASLHRHRVWLRTTMVLLGHHRRGWALSISRRPCLFDTYPKCCSYTLRNNRQ